MATVNRMNITISAEASGLLERVGNKSGYLETILMDRWQAWQAGIRACEQAGLRAHEVKAICDVLNGCYMLGEYLSGQRIGLEMHDAQSQNSICKKWKIAPARWNEIINNVVNRGELAHSIGTIVREFWTCENRAVENAVERLGWDTSTLSARAQQALASEGVLSALPTEIAAIGREKFEGTTGGGPKIAKEIADALKAVGVELEP